MRLSPKQKATTRHEQLKGQRSQYLSDWRDTSMYVLGYTDQIIGGDSGNLEGDISRNEMLYNEVGKFAIRTMASGMQAGIASPARPWFTLNTPDPDMMDFGPVKTWLDDVKQILYRIFARSNFYRSAYNVYKHLGVFGLANVGEYEDFNTVVRFETYPMGSYCLNAGEKSDTMYRDYTMTVSAAVNKFGLRNLSVSVQRLYEQCLYDKPVKILHVIEPNRGRKHTSPLSRDMPIRSMYFEIDGQGDDPILESGFRENPFFAPRWDPNSDTAYSRSYPGIDSIGTNKGLQIQEMDKAIAIEKMHNPPLVGDASIARDKLDLIAGGVSYMPNMAATGKPGLAPIYDVSPRIAELTADIKEKEERIRSHFYADLFLMISNMERAQITATEIAHRQEEKMLMLGPVLESLNNDFFDPMIDRTFNIAERRGMLPPPPQEIQGQKLEVEYTSILAQAQKAISTSSMESTAAFTMQLATANPDVLDKIDMDQMVDEHARAKGAPPSVIRSDEDVAALREQRAAQAQQAAMMEQAQMAAQGAKTLSETDTTGDNALTAIAGAMG